MCQAKPGPRCSPDSKRALDIAEKQYYAALGKLSKAKHIHGHTSEQYRQAEEHLHAQYENFRIAQRDYDGTPEGIRALEAAIEANRTTKDPSAVSAYIEAREARKEALKVVEEAERGNLPTLKGTVSTLNVKNNGDGTYTITQNNAPGHNPERESGGSLIVAPKVNEYGHTEYKTSLGRSYLTVHKDNPQTPEQIAQLLHNNVVIRNPEVTYIDRQSAYMQKAHQSSYTLQNAYDADLDNDPANYHEQAELYNEHREALREIHDYRRSLEEGATPDPEREALMDANLASIQHFLDQDERNNKDGKRASTQLLGASDAQQHMATILKESPTKKEAINKLRTLEPPFRNANGQEIYNETYEPHYVAGFEKERTRLLKEALNYKAW